jgi:hypothetical protein
MNQPFRLTPPVPSENDVEAGCITILELHQYWVVKLHAGIFRHLDDPRKPPPAKPRYIHGVPKGTPDYACLHEYHRNFLLEVKRPGGKLSADQETRHADIRFRYRLVIVVVESVEELCNFLAQHERSP